jgi:hypothetical protein
MSHQTEAETADDATYQNRVRVALADKTKAVFQDATATDLDLRTAAGVSQRGERYVRDAAYALATSGIDHASTDAEMDAALLVLWPLTIAYQVGALTAPATP